MLAVDVGNTHITSGIFEGKQLKAVFRVPTDQCLKSCAFLIHIPQIHGSLSDGAVIVSVRRPATAVILRELTESTRRPPLLVGVDTPMGIKVCYDTRETLGVDRLVCAAAAYHVYRKKGRPVIAIDMGTATTIDYVTEDGAFLGGMIAPGLISAYEGLLSSTPQLPRLHELSAASVIGTSTEACLRSGVTMGHVAMIRKVVEMMARSYRSRPVVVVTGGLAGLAIDALSTRYIHDGDLILKGLSMIYSLREKK